MNEIPRLPVDFEEALVGPYGYNGAITIGESSSHLADPLARELLERAGESTEIEFPDDATKRARNHIALKIRSQGLTADIDYKFHCWRTAALKKAHARYRAIECDQPPPTEKEIRKFVASCAKAPLDHPRRDYYPHERYYREEVLPTVYALAKTPEDVARISRDALECLAAIVEAPTKLAEPKRDLIHNFFANRPAEDAGFDYRTTGQFGHFYRIGGRELALAVAAFQGRQCDEHYDGLNYSYKTYQLQELFVGVLNQIPREFWKPALQTFLTQMKRCGRYSAVPFWKSLPPLVKALQEAECDLGDFFLLAENLHVIECEGSIVFEQLDFRKPENACKELKALEATGPYKTDLIKLTRHILFPHSSYKRSFSFAEAPGPYGHLRFSYHPVHILQKLKDDGYCEQQIHAIFGVVDRAPLLGEEAALLINFHKEIEANFPGGVDALLHELAKLKGKKACSSKLIEQAVALKLTSQEWQAYLTGGQTIIEAVGDAADVYYFRMANEKLYGSREIAHMTRWETEFVAMLKKSPEEFEAKMRAVAGQLENLGEVISRDGREEHELTCALLTYCNDPQFPAFLSALENIFDSIRTLGAQAENFTEHSHIDRLCHRIVHIFSELPRTFGGTYEGALPVIDYPKLARASSGVIKAPDEPVEIANSLSYLSQVLPALDKDAVPDAAVHGLLVAHRNIEKLLIRIKQSREEADLEVLERDIARVREEIGCLSAQFPKEAPEAISLVDGLSRDLDIGQRLLSMRRVLDAGFVITERSDLPELPLLHHGSGVTRAIIASASYLAAIGAMPINGITEGIRPIPIGNGAGILEAVAPSDRAVAIGEISHNKGVEVDVMRNIRQVAPLIEREILRHRLALLGLQAVGGKHHAKVSMDEHVLDLLKNIFGLESTPFHLIHAGQSLVLPPVPSAYELELFVRVLEMFGVVEDLQLQIAGAGRIDNERAAIVGSTVMLSTLKDGIPQPGAFSTNQNSATGARIMAYDAKDNGVRQYGLPFDVKVAPGRTDYLGAQSTGDILTYQIVQNLAVQGQFGYGPLQDMQPDFAALHLANLRQDGVGLSETIYRSAWVFDLAENGDTLEMHEAMARTIAETRSAHLRRPDLGVIADTNLLLRKTMKEIHARSPAIAAAYPEEVAKLRTY